jgi:hypothetical protein
MQNVWRRFFVLSGNSSIRLQTHNAPAISEVCEPKFQEFLQTSLACAQFFGEY